MATIRKRGKRWQVQVRRKGFGATSRSFLHKSDAETWARQMETAADKRGLPADPKALNGWTVGQLIERYRDTVVVGKRGRDVETFILNALLRQPFAKQTLADIKPEAFATYRDDRLKVVTGVTVQRELSLLQQAFDIARREWGVPILVNPLADIRKPSPNLPRDRRLEGDELERLIGATSKNRNKLMRPLISFAVETGMRRGELLRMKWADIDRANQTLRIPETKNGHPRTIPLSKAALRVLDGVPNANEGRVFPTTEEAVKLSWVRLTRRARIEDLHFHDLRHEAISRFFERGLSLPEVALISGHRDYRMLLRYTHLRPESLVAKLDANP